MRQGREYKQNRKEVVLKKIILSKNHIYTFHIDLQTLKTPSWYESFYI